MASVSSVAFSKKIDPDNAAIQKLEKFCQENEVSTGKSTIGDEKQWNVFMRTSSKAVQDATGTKDPIEAMGKLREMKASTLHAARRSKDIGTHRTDVGFTQNKG